MAFDRFDSSAWYASPNVVWVATVLGLTIKLLFFVVVARDFYVTTVQLHENSARNVAMMVEQDMARNIEVYDLSLRAVIDGLKNPIIMRQPKDVQHVALFSRSGSAQSLGALVVIDRDGWVVMDAAGVEPRRAYLGDRPHFIAHRDAKADIGLTISKPFRTRLQDGSWSVAFTRRLASPDGSFAGMVSGTVPLDFLRRRFNELAVGEGGRISLFYDDGTLMLQDAANDDKVGQNWSRAPIFEHLPYHDADVFFSPTSMDGVARWYAYRRVGNTPLVVSIGMAEADVLLAWRNRVGLLAAVYLLMAMSVTGLVFLFVGELKRRVAAEQTEKARARQDGLTALSNRIGFDERFAAEWSRATAEESPIALLMMDIDHFKLFNDTYGHVAGDQALQLVAETLRKALPSAREFAAREFSAREFPARMGGEEFVIILPGYDEARALALANDIGRAISDLGVANPASKHEIVTVSAGAAAIVPPVGMERELLLALADAALYLAKAEGRNTVRGGSLVSEHNAPVRRPRIRPA